MLLTKALISSLLPQIDLMEYGALGFDIFHGMKPAGRRMNRIAHFQKLHRRRLADTRRAAGHDGHLVCLIHLGSPCLFIREGRFESFPSLLCLHIDNVGITCQHENVPNGPNIMEGKQIFFSRLRAREVRIPKESL
jgi:hypothetical protein